VRAQLSLEFMLYTALVAASTVSAIATFLYVQGSQGARVGRAYTEELVALINANMAYASSDFYAVVPSGLCNGTLRGDEINTNAGALRIDGNLTILGSACSGQGGMERLELARLPNGTYALEGAS